MAEDNSTERVNAQPSYEGERPRRHGRDEREGGAPVEVVLRRFFRDVQQSEIMTEIKRRRHFEKSPTRNARRRAAVGRAARRSQRQNY